MTVNTESPRTLSALLECLPSLPHELLQAQRAGHTAITRFQRSWSMISEELMAAIEDDELDLESVSLVHTVTRAITSMIAHMQAIDTQGNLAVSELRVNASRILFEQSGTQKEPKEPTLKASSLPFAWVRPLLQFVLDNISSPYPSADEKKLLLEQCVTAGWSSVTQRKLEDWMNMARGKMGYTSILKSDTVRDDRRVLADYVRRVLFGGPAERAGIPAVIIRRIEMMQRWVLDQYDSRAAKDQTSSWARDVVDLVQRLSVPDNVGPDAVSDDDEEDSSYDDDESDSGSDTLYSETDVEDDSDVLPTSVIGAKRKYDGLGLGRPPSRMVSRSSSNSSLSSHGTLADLSVCDALVSSSTSTDSTDGSDGARPAKRRRRALDDLSAERASPTPTAVADSPPVKPKQFEHSYRSQKRKRSLTEDDSSASQAKRVKHIAPPCAQVASTDLDVFDSICHLNWDASSAKAELADNVDLSAFIVDTPSLDVESCPDHLLPVVAACCEPLNELPSTLHLDASFAWSKLQAYALERMLRHGVHVVPSHDLTPVKLTPTITFDASSFSPEELACLCSLSESPGAGDAFVDPPNLGLGLGFQDTNGLLQPGDASLPALTDGSMMPSAEVDFDEWYASLLSTPLVA